MKKTITLLLAVMGLMAWDSDLSAQLPKEKPTVYMVANAHFDTQWRWTVQQSITEYIPNTLYQNFALIEEYPDYIFNFEGAIKYYWVKEYYPELYERLKGYVKAGRWHTSGASWDANDPNIPSIESGIRNILYAQQFYQEEFGVKSTDIMLPDCFGFSYTLPTVATHCGLIGFGTQKLTWRNNPFYPGGKKFPFYFGIWQGIDGSRITSLLDGGHYAWNTTEPATDVEDFKIRLADMTIPAAYRYFGTNSSRKDHDKGGSPQPSTVKFLEEAIHNPGEAYNIKMATSDQMYKDYFLDERLPVFDGELLLDVHSTGCYTSKAQMKRLNRRNERLLGATESIALLADRIGAVDYPYYTIDNSWRRVLWHQFHDDLTGTSVAEAYQFSYNDEYLTQRQMNSTVQTSLEKVTDLMNTAVKGFPVAVYNNVSARNTDLVKAQVALPAGCKGVEVYSPSGKKVKSQLVKIEDGKADIVFAASDPSMSVGIYDVRPVKNPSTATRLKAKGNTIENSIYKVTLNENGDIASIIDKRCAKELVHQGESFGLAFWDDNESDPSPSWEILKKVLDRKPTHITDNVKITVEECGPVRAALRVERTKAGSTFIQRIMLTDGATDERIDVETTVDWWSLCSLLKAEFPMSFDSPLASYDVGLGNVKRDNNTIIEYEVFAHQWADMTAEDNSYGVTIMNDSKYGWDKPDDHTFRLTLLHTPTGRTKSRPEQKTQDRGLHTFTYSIVGHEGALDPVKADILSDALNQEKITFNAQSHGGALGRSLSMVSTTVPSIRIKAFKKAQDGDGLIVRVYEQSGKAAKGQIQFSEPILSAEEVNGVEEAKAAASFSGKSLDVDINGFGLRTYRVRLAAPAVKSQKPQFENLSLPYNATVYSSDAFVAFGRMDNDWHSYAAELIPEKLEYRGVPFTFGPADFPDALTASGQTLEVPEGTKTLHLLVASSGDDVDADFIVGDKVYTRRVDNFTGFYGVYGWPDYYEGTMRYSDVAYVGTHRHHPGDRNEPYVFTYMYLISLPMDGQTQVELPTDKKVTIFSATAEK